MNSNTLILLLSVVIVNTVVGDTVIYDGSTGQLVNGWENWSWATINLMSTAFVATGYKYSVSILVNNWEAFAVHSNAGFTTKDTKSLQFWVNGGASDDEPVNIQLLSGNDAAGNSVPVTGIAANTWTKVEIPLSSFNVEGKTLNGIWFQAGTASNAGTVYLDGILLIAAPPAPVTPVTITVDIKSDRHAFSNLVFGVNFANDQQFQRNKYTVNRWGGEANTRYAWDIDTTNHASDWFFENLANDDADPSKLPFNSTSDAFVQTTFDNNAIPIITVPLIGYTPKDRVTRCSFSVKKYGPAEKTDQYQPDCGNGNKPDGTPITGNDPADTSRIIDEQFVMKWLAHFDQVFGKGKVNLFELDNEPGLWHVIHRDVHPAKLTYDELWNKTVQYAGAIRKSYPDAKIYGPVPWGWCAYMFSAADDCKSGPDRQAHGDIPILQWYIQQIGEYQKKNNVQLVDVIDVHIYPQASDISFSDKEDAVTAALRFRSTRALWDTTYVDESWIGQPIMLIPRIKNWIDQYSPGLKIAISEYNWGNDNLITGALAQVLLLGIMARENVYLATRWIVPDYNTRTENAFQLFTNYDGKGASVKGDSVKTTTDNVDEVEGFSFYTSSTIYIVLVNKRGDGAVPVTIDISSAASTGKGTVYAFSASENVKMTGTVNIMSGKGVVTLAAWSAAIVVISI